MFLSESNVALAVLIPLVGYLASKWLIQKKNEKEERKLAAFHMASKLREHGLNETAHFVERYAVDDYSGMAHQARSLGKLFLSGETAVLGEFGKTFDRLLKTKLATEDGRVMVAALLHDASQPADPSVVANAPAAAIK